MPLNSLWGGLLPSDTTLRDSLLTRVTGVSRRFFSRLINFYNGGLVSCCPVNQSYVNRSLLFSGFPPHLGHHRVLSEFPVPYSRFSLGIYFVRSIDSVCISIPVSQFIPPPPFPPRFVVHTFALYVCISNSALQIRSIPFFPDSM